jgi:hypothetical protein
MTPRDEEQRGDIDEQGEPCSAHVPETAIGLVVMSLVIALGRIIDRRDLLAAVSKRSNDLAAALFEILASDGSDSERSTPIGALNTP